MADTENGLCELTVTFNTNEDLVLHVTAAEATKFHKRMENFVSGRRSRTDNFCLHSIGGYTLRSDSVVYYSAIKSNGTALHFALTPAS